MNTSDFLEDGCIAEFSMGSVKDDIASLSVKEGKQLYPELPESTFKGVPTFRDALMVEIRIPGNKDEIVHTEAWLSNGTTPAEAPTHDRRFPKALARFHARQAAGPQGFPLTEWAAVTRAQVDNLAYLNIKTVEALANVNDDLVSRIMGGYDLKRKAQAFLAQRNGPDAMREELEALKAQLAALTQSQPSPAHVTVLPAAAQAAVLGAPTPAPAPEYSFDGGQVKRRPGRPRKAVQPMP